MSFQHPFFVSLQIALLVQKGGLTEVQVLRQLGAKHGTICGGVDFHNRVKNGEFGTDHNIVVNVTLPVEDVFANDIQSFDERDDAPVSNPPPQATRMPPLSDFMAVISSLYDSIRGSPSLTRQALIDLKRLKEDCLSTEAHENLGAIEAGPQGHFATGTPITGFAKLPNSGGSLKRFRDWHENLHFGVQRPKGTRKKGYESDESFDGADPSQHRIPNPSGANCAPTVDPGKFVVIGRKVDRYCHGSQTDLDQQCLDAAEALATPWIPDEVDNGENTGQDNPLPAPQFPVAGKQQRGKATKPPPKPRKPRVTRKVLPLVKPETRSRDRFPSTSTLSGSQANADFDFSALAIPPEDQLPPDVPIASVRAAASWAIGTKYQSHYECMIAAILDPARGSIAPPA